jgi:hypothetical protein
LSAQNRQTFCRGNILFLGAIAASPEFFQL